MRETARDCCRAVADPSLHRAWLTHTVSAAHTFATTRVDTDAPLLCIAVAISLSVRRRFMCQKADRKKALLCSNSMRLLPQPSYSHIFSHRVLLRWRWAGQLSRVSAMASQSDCTAGRGWRPKRSRPPLYAA
jgi:hypothetical protein